MQDANEKATFRRLLIQTLKQGIASFDLKRLKEAQGVSNDVAESAVRAVFMSQCMRASKDGRVTEREIKTLAKLGMRLQLSVADQDKYLAAAKNSVFQDELFKALDDGLISDDEAEALHSLRKTLGLPEMDRDALNPTGHRVRRRRKTRRQRPAQKDQKGRLQTFWDAAKCFNKHFALLNTVVVFVIVLCVAWICFGLLFGAFEENGIKPGFEVPFAFLCAGLLSGVYFFSFLNYRCCSCGASWVLRGTGTSELETGWLSDTIHAEFECRRCGDLTWKKGPARSGSS